MMDIMNMNMKQSDTITFTNDFYNIKNQFTHNQLIKALYWIWDAFERASIPFFLTGNTMNNVAENKLLDGYAIECGVRLLDWKSSARYIFDTFATPISEEGNIVIYKYEGVPIILKIYKEDDPCIVSTDTKMYFAEAFKVPNPINRFKEVFNE
jgi:hypothetical protein